MAAVLLIRRGKRDNLEIIFHNTHRDGSNEGSQHMFSLRNKKNYP